ncbi:hypothetical protein QYF36_023759 [Acer negundo]|nr:hypothetical protein QYF36_023759 [Acer negundo]
MKVWKAVAFPKVNEGVLLSKANIRSCIAANRPCYVVITLFNRINKGEISSLPHQLNRNKFNTELRSGKQQKEKVQLRRQA